MIKNSNIYKTLSKIIGCLLVLSILFAVIYTSNNFSVSSMSGEEDENKNYEMDTHTETILLSEVCLTSECDYEKTIKYNSEKESKFEIKRNNMGEVILNSLSIDGKNIEIPEGAVLEEVGIVDSKYFVLSYILNDKKTIYYMDENLREAKTVSNVFLDTRIDNHKYNYYACQISEIANGNEMKHTYELSLLKNGTFLSKIISTEAGTCE